MPSSYSWAEGGELSALLSRLRREADPTPGQTPSRVQMAACRAGLHRGAGGGAGEVAGGSEFGLEGGAGAEAATNRGSARTPLPAANHRSVSPSRPSRPLFPLARWPPRVSGATTSARADQAMCTRVQGPLGGVLASPSDGLLVPCTLSLICPEWLWEGRDKALRRRTLAWGGGHGTEEHRTWAEVQLWLHLSFLVLPTALPVLRGFP